ncbi:MAG TPA: hypothetical protein VH062_29420 [Polyangiaceae bacterium]|jgi:transcriptional regulator with XRE-family HTH domain|nr:hypothetical protein [Polyangiaceae bacterium]
MTRVDQLLAKTKNVFEKLVKAEEESLSRASIEGLSTEEDYEVVRGALLATEKVEAAMGRAGGLTVKRAQGNRREWGAAAESRARRFLEEEVQNHTGNTASSGDGALKALKAVYEHWPQSSIADALSVSQATVSNWLRTRNVPGKYAEPLHRLSAQLAVGAKDATRAQPPRVEEAPYAEWLREELARQEINAVDLAQRADIHVNTILALLEGRTEKPQQRTRQKIEQVLRSHASSAGASRSQPAVEEEAWYYIGLPWTKEEIDQVPDEPGVYIISDRLGRPAYIGVAHKGGIRTRLRDHNKLRWTVDVRVASTFSYALAERMPRGSAGQLALSLEKLLIKFMGNAILINEKDVEDIAD